MRVLCLILLALPLRASDALQWSGFAILRGTHATEAVPLDDDAVSAQVQLGIDWRPSPAYGGTIHVVARSEDDHSDRGRIGVVQAYLEQNLVRGEHRLRFTEGAFFLATSRENVDALWESPYTISSSALNTWLGEELRPIGIDAQYTLRRRWTAGVTVYRGNETFGALPHDRGWMLHDRWSVLGEHVRSNEEYVASVSAENDGRLGWAARGRWNNDRATLQLTHIDNRADGLEYGRLLNWDTQFDIAGGSFTAGDWTFAAETGWGVTAVVVEGITFPTDIAASYVLASRRFANARASLRADDFRVDGNVRRALTAAVFWTPRGALQWGVEGIVSEGESRVAIEGRYRFAW
ncbi:MAG TPA: hypothetical protein VHK90_15155 [Thermoanaerobaculia bacterium]|nr:hypothetical protein [Thermoanaerobaculia bacterium]